MPLGSQVAQEFSHRRDYLLILSDACIANYFNMHFFLKKYNLLLGSYLIETIMINSKEFALVLQFVHL